jgi:hypothetical protein
MNDHTAFMALRIVAGSISAANAAFCFCKHPQNFPIGIGSISMLIVFLFARDRQPAESFQEYIVKPRMSIAGAFMSVAMVYIFFLGK